MAPLLFIALAILACASPASATIFHCSSFDCTTNSVRDNLCCSEACSCEATCDPKKNITEKCSSKPQEDVEYELLLRVTKCEDVFYFTDSFEYYDDVVEIRSKDDILPPLSETKIEGCKRERISKETIVYKRKKLPRSRRSSPLAKKTPAHYATTLNECTKKLGISENIATPHGSNGYVIGDGAVAYLKCVSLNTKDDYTMRSAILLSAIVDDDFELTKRVKAAIGLASFCFIMQFICIIGVGVWAAWKYKKRDSF